MGEIMDTLKQDPHVARMIEDGWTINQVSLDKDGNVGAISYSKDLPEEVKDEMAINSLIADMRRRWWPFGKKKINRIEKFLKEKK